MTRVESRREHRVPLSAPAVGLLKELYTVVGNPYLFIGPKKVATLSVTALVAALRRVGRNETAHGFGRTSARALEISLAHATGSDVERSYRRGDMLDKRRKVRYEPAAGRRGSNDAQGWVSVTAKSAKSDTVRWSLALVPYNGRTFETSWRRAIFMDEGGLSLHETLYKTFYEALLRIPRLSPKSAVSSWESWAARFGSTTAESRRR